MDRSDARSGGNVAIWILSVLLALIFLATGIAKLLGLPLFGLQAAAMADFPDWIRVVIGVLEIVGALSLLAPRLAAVGAVMLALLMVPATITQAMSNAAGVWVPALLFVVLLFVAWRREPEAVLNAYQGVRSQPHPVLREGVIAGLIGATVIAIWFLIIDLIAGRPLFTPETLGRAVLDVFGTRAGPSGTAVPVILYTIVHYAAFIVFGIIAAAFVHAAKQEPSVLLGFFMLFVAFEIGFHGFVALLQRATALGTLAWYQIMVGNILAAVAMGMYLWRVNPAVGSEFAHALDQT